MAFQSFASDLGPTDTNGVRDVFVSTDSDGDGASHMRVPEDGGSRIAIIMNGSPLFTGDAGSGTSGIRRWILENDWLDALIAIPEQIFYNTGIATYIWVVSNRKPPERRGKVLLVNTTTFWKPMRKSMGDKRRELGLEHIQKILDLYLAYEPGEYCKIFDTTDFGYRKITVERPLQLNFQVSPELSRMYRFRKTFRHTLTARCARMCPMHGSTKPFGTTKMARSVGLGMRSTLTGISTSISHPGRWKTSSVIFAS